MPARLNLDDALIASLYQEGKTGKEIADLLGCSTIPIFDRLRKSGIPIHSGRTRHEISTDKIASLYQDGYSSIEIGKMLDCSDAMIRGRLKKAEVELRTLREWRSKAVNGHIFDEIDTEEKAFWLGFITADGNVHFPKRGGTPRFSMGLSEKDREHLIRLREFLGSDHSIMTYRTMVKLAITSKPLCEGLMKWGVVPRKSYNFQGLPEIAPELKHHMLRGLFDGDGHIGIRKDNRRGQGDTPIVHLVGHRQCMQEVRAIFDEFCHRHPPIEKPVAAKSDLIGSIRYGSQSDTVSILKYLYKDANIFLERKKVKADEIISRWGRKFYYGEWKQCRLL